MKDDTIQFCTFLSKNLLLVKLRHFSWMSFVTHYCFLDIPFLFCLSSVIEITIEFGSCRPHPNECSGSDLDGDIYFVSWDPDLIPTRMVAPMDYTQALLETLDHDVMIEVF